MAVFDLVRNEDKKIVIHISSKRPLKKDGRDRGRSEYFYFKKGQERRKVEGKRANALYIRIQIIIIIIIIKL